MRIFLFFLLTVSTCCFGQSDKKINSYIRKQLGYLASDKLEGRRTGTEGERLAFEHIVKELKKNKIGVPEGQSGYIQEFEVNDGLAISQKTSLSLGDKTFLINEDFIPFPYSPNGKTDAWGESILYYDIQSLIADNKDNPHFDFEEELYQKIKSATEIQPQGLVVVFNSSDTALSYVFDAKNKKKTLWKQVIYCNNKTVEKLKSNSSEKSPVRLTVDMNTGIRTGHNVIGMINNNAPLTVILGAHYDHLGYGEDHNSLYAGKDKQIHNGADDNASGTSALLALSRIIATSGNKKFNYLFVAFSGEELGLFGSKYFTEHSPVDLSKVNYMINMDMVGRLNDSTHGVTLGGFGTSPAWGQLISLQDGYFKIKVDSSGSGPSDHTSFYKKDIPVLFFFTGTHSDYHKPSDDADKINYEGEVKIVRYIMSLIEKTASLEKLPFTKTRDAAPGGKSSFKVTLGIMPDYTFSDNGVRVDGVSDNRPAQKAGIKTGDVIIKLGDYLTGDVEAYMQALSKFKKGDTTTVNIKRGTDELTLDVTF